MGQDRAWEVVNAHDQGYAVAGQTFSFGTGGEGFLITFDSNMNVEWSRIYGTTNTELSMGAYYTADSGYAVVGMTGAYMNERIFNRTLPLYRRETEAFFSPHALPLRTEIFK